MMRFNINDNVRVRLTDEGRAIHRKIWDDLRAEHPLVGPYTPPKEDADGFTRWQLWRLMQDFGPAIRMGFRPPFEPDIEVEVAEWDTLMRERNRISELHAEAQRRIDKLRTALSDLLATFADFYDEPSANTTVAAQQRAGRAALAP
jgi:hypothetical protein